MLGIRPLMAVNDEDNVIYRRKKRSLLAFHTLSYEGNATGM
jgi:hypothetical protein